MESSSNVTVTEVHPFELAGLGKAPFRVVGSAERVFQAGPGAPVKAGGCCKFCYTGIRYAAIIQSRDGNVFDVGLDCVRKVDLAAYKEAREMRRAELRETRTKEHREAAAAAREARLAEEAALALTNEAAFRAAEPEIAACIDALIGDDGFAGSCAGRALSNVRAIGEVTSYTDEVQSTRWKLRELHAERTATGHAGTVGKRETFRARYVGRYAYETSFGIKVIYKLAVARADGSHALLTWKTGSSLTLAEGGHVTLGTELSVTASVKAHGEFRGQAQTEIQRPKFALIK